MHPRTYRMVGGCAQMARAEMTRAPGPAGRNTEEGPAAPGAVHYSPEAKTANPFVGPAPTRGGA
jgi:hypothetical protein